MKKSNFADEFDEIPNIEYFDSVPLGFRHRTEFSIIGPTGDKQYAMTVLQKRNNQIIL